MQRSETHQLPPLSLVVRCAPLQTACSANVESVVLLRRIQTTTHLRFRPKGPLGRIQCVSAQRAISSNSLAQRARNTGHTHTKGPTGRPFDSPPFNRRMTGPLGLDNRGDAKFLGRWPRLLELLALWAETQQRRSARLSKTFATGRRDCDLIGLIGLRAKPAPGSNRHRSQIQQPALDTFPSSLANDRLPVKLSVE